MNDNALVTVTQALVAPAMREQFVHMLPENVPVDRFTEITLMAIRQSPEILQADRQTLYDACLQLARRGLLPDKKEAALVVFNTKDGDRWVKKVQALPMVEGILKEMGKAGVKAYAVSVYANDQVRIWNDDEGQHVLHEPIMFADRGARVGCFAAGKMADGRTYVEAMNMAELEKTALRSKQAKKDNGGKPFARGGTWASDPERMEQKTALHRLKRRIPILDDDALQNLKELEEESDIELAEPKEGDIPGVSGTIVKENKATAYEGITLSKRPRALQSVVDQARVPIVPEVPTPPNPPDEYQGEDII